MQRRRSFGKTALVTALFWVALTIWVLNVPPDGSLAVGGFFFLVFWSLWLPLSVLLVNGRRGLLVTVAILGTLAMKTLGLFSYLSIGAWWTIIVFVEIWFSNS